MSFPSALNICGEKIVKNVSDEGAEEREVARETLLSTAAPLCLSRCLQRSLGFEIILFHFGPNRSQGFGLEA